MELRVLGTFQLERDGQLLSPGGPKERRLLAVLIARLGEVVSLDTLADVLWDGAPPRSSVKSIQTFVTRVRSVLNPDREGRTGSVIRTASPGYRLAVDRSLVDAYAFADLVRLARQALDDADPEAVERQLGRAFSLWRGTPYGELSDHPYFITEVRRLEQVRLTGLEIRVDAGLALGRHAGLVGEVEALCAEYPLHEPFWVQLVTALCVAGRQADAFAAFRRVRALLSEEVGADPGPALRALEQRMLRQDPTLIAPPRTFTPRAQLPAELGSASGPFVGRTEELGWLHEAWVAVQGSGDGRLLLIGGPPGSGRSRLLEQFAVQVYAHGATVHYGQARLGGICILDDLDQTAASALASFGGKGGTGSPTLYVATYDPDRADPGLRELLAGTLHEERTLGPLSPDHVAELVARLVPDADGGLIDDVMAASSGWPAAVKQAAAELAGRRAARRVVAAADEAGAARQRLVDLRTQIADGVRELERLRADPATRIACPYMGLARYDEADASLFHGREDLVASLCGRLVDTRFVAVVGPSGAGKSSLVRAGLLPALAAGVLPQLAGAARFLTTPGTDLTVPDPDGPAVVVVDQFEEVFTAVADETVRAEYLDQLTDLVRRSSMRIVVVIRGDFVGACGAHAELAHLVGDGTVLVGPMRAAEIRRAVELPARQVGLDVEPQLLDLVASDVDGQPGALPLLSTALVAVWEHRFGRTLTAEAYIRAGGVSGSLARLAEAAYTRLDPAAQAAARRILLRLADSGEGGVLTRRRVPRSELGDDPATAHALITLVERRLVTTGDSGVEVTHEALLSHWPRLSAWLAEDEQGRALRRHLAPSAREWLAAGRPDTELYRGARLAAALDWSGDRWADLTAAEQDFLSASRDLSDRELRAEIGRADREARGRRRLTAALAAVASLLLLASLATVAALDRQRAASAAGRAAESRRLGALALVTDDLDRSLLLAVQAVRTDDNWETRGDLLAVLSRNDHALGQIRGITDGGALESVAVTADGSILVADQRKGYLLIRDPSTLAAATGEVVRLGMSARSITTGPDPHALFVTVVFDVLKGTQAVLYWDAAERRTLHTYDIPPGVTGSTRHVSLSADHRTVAVPTQGPELLLYDFATGALRARVALPDAPRDIWPFGPLFATAVAGSGALTLIDPTTARVVESRGMPAAGDVVVSPDGRILGIFSGEHVTLVDAATGHVMYQLSGGTRAAAHAAFSPDGSLFAVAGDDQITSVWEVGTGELRDNLHGHTGPVTGLAFTPDGRTAFTVGQDASVIAWDVRGDRSFGARQSRRAVLAVPASTTHTALTSVFAPIGSFSRDRRSAYMAAADGSGAGLFDLGTGQPLATFAGFFDSPEELATPDVDARARYEATSTGLSRFDVTNPASRLDWPAPPGTEAIVNAVSGDGHRVAVMLDTPKGHGEYDMAGVSILDANTMTSVGPSVPVDFLPFAIFLNQDGSQLIASELFGNRVQLWDTQTATKVWETDIGASQASTLAFSPDGQTLAMGTRFGAVVQVDRRTGAVISRQLALAGWLVSAEFSPDGQVLAVGGGDGGVHLFESGSLRTIGQPLLTNSTWAYATFSLDGSRLWAIDERGRVVSWNARPDAWLGRACAIAGRDLSRTEWDTYLPGAQYEPTCGHS